MENDIIVSPHPANSQTDAFGLISSAPPTCQINADGQSVENVLSPDISLSSSSSRPLWESQIGSFHPLSESHRKSWFVIRATRGRGEDIYNELINLNLTHLEVYIPRYHKEHITISEGHPEKIVKEGILHNGLLFVRTTRDEFAKLIQGIEPYPYIKGLTPYYDHFHEIEAGRNDYLVVPDIQFKNFRTILESQDTHILVDQELMPTYLNGKKVKVISGPFAGVTGTLLRWKGLRRVFVKLDQLGTFGTGFIRTCDFQIIKEDLPPSFSLAPATEALLPESPNASSDDE